MRSRTLFRFAVASVALLACTPTTENAPVVTPENPAKATPVVAAAEIAPAATAPTTAVAAPAPAPAVDLSPLPPAADALAKLPPSAATYFSARVAVLASRALATGSFPQELLHELTSGLGAETPEAMIAAFGIDPRRPVIGAMVGPSEKSARAVPEAALKDGSDKALQKAIYKHGADATLVRILVPLAPGTTPAVAAAALVKSITHARTMSVCPGAPDCTRFDADAPLVVGQGSRMAVAAYADGADLRLDMSIPLFVAGTDPDAVFALLAFRGQRGGFKARCSRFDPAATLSLCVDPVLTGDMAAAQGYGKTVQAIQGSGLEAPLRRKIAGVGRDEAKHNVELGSPSRRLAEDGTLVMDLQATPNTFVGTWALTKASRPAVEKAFAVERCAAGQAIFTELLPAMRAAFGDPGPDFADPKKTLTSFRESGWGAFGVALGGTWPNLIDGFLGVKGEVPGIPAGVRVCARADAGRLVLGVK
jgi:hypothetical protein